MISFNSIEDFVKIDAQGHDIKKVYYGLHPIWEKPLSEELTNDYWVEFIVDRRYDGKSYFFRDLNNGTKVIVHLDTNTFHYAASLDDNLKPADVELTKTLYLSSNMYPWPYQVEFSGEKSNKTKIYSWGYTNYPHVQSLIRSDWKEGMKYGSYFLYGSSMSLIDYDTHFQEVTNQNDSKHLLGLAELTKIKIGHCQIENSRPVKASETIRVYWRDSNHLPTNLLGWSTIQSQRITFSRNVTSNVVDMSFFTLSLQASEISFNSCDFSSLKSMMFFAEGTNGYNEISSIDFTGSTMTGNVNALGAFKNNKSLKSINLSSWQGTLTNTQEMFYNSTIRNIDLSGLTLEGPCLRVFNTSTERVSLYIGKWIIDTSEKSLNELELFNTEKVYIHIASNGYIVDQDGNDLRSLICAAYSNVTIDDFEYTQEIKWTKSAVILLDKILQESYYSSNQLSNYTSLYTNLSNS